MARLIYSAIFSLDGYVADRSGNFDWAAPDEEVRAFVNDLERVGFVNSIPVQIRGIRGGDRVYERYGGRRTRQRLRARSRLKDRCCALNDVHGRTASPPN
jgi:hypothetical protein